MFQAGTMATLEAAVEQSQRMEELMSKGQSPGEALKNSEGVFWQNMAMLTATNAPFFSPVGRLARAAMSSGSEGAQERFQAVIQDVASGRGQWRDFLDPDKHQTETIVGMITGGVAGGVLPGDAKDKDETGAPKESEDFEGDLPKEFEADEPSMGMPTEEPAIPETTQATAPKDTRRQKEQRREAELEQMQAQGATEEEIELAASIVALERGLSDSLGVDVNLEERLTPEQIKELAVMARDAKNEPDARSAWYKEDKVIKRAEDMLLRSRGTRKEEIAKTKEQVKIDKRARRTVKAMEKAAMKDLPPHMIEEMTEYPVPSQGAKVAEKPTIKSPKPAVAKEPVAPQEVKAPAKTPVEKIKKAAKAKKSPRKAINEIGGTVRGDNPGGEWLKHERKRARDAGAFGANTQTIKNINLSTGELVEIPGYNNEQDHIRQDNVDELADSMKKAGGYSGPAIVVGVNYAGVPTITEGNHRVRAAIQAGIKDIPVEIHYHAGGERESGSMSPEKVANKALKLDRVSEESPQQYDDMMRAKSEKARREEEEKKKDEPKPRELTEEEEKLERELKDILRGRGLPKKPKANQRREEQKKKQPEPAELTEEEPDGDALFNEYMEKVKKARAKKAAKVEPTEAVKGYQTLPTVSVSVEPKTFQRRTDVDPKTGANEGKMKVIMAGFKEEKLNPIVVWRDPKTNKMMVIDGHHTLEAAKRSNVASVVVKIFKGTRKEAIQESKVLNDERTVNDIFARAATLREMREAGESEASIVRASKKYDKEATMAVALSSLNPNGKTMQAMKALENAPDERDTAGKYGRWIGEARKKFPTLTNQHENEMFDYLDRNPGTTKPEFGAAVEERSTFGDFSGMESLNLGGLVKKTDAKQAFDKRYNALTKNKERLEAERKKELEPHNEVLKKNELIAFQRELTEEEQAQTAEAKKEIKAIKRKYTRTEKLNGKSFKAGSIAELEHEIAQLEKDWNESLDEGMDQGAMFSKEGKKKKAPAAQIPTEKNVQEFYEAAVKNTEKAGSKTNKQTVEEQMGPLASMANPVDAASNVVRKVAKRFGVEVVFFSKPETNRGLVNGFVVPGDSKRVFINVKSSKPLLYVLGHEIGHYMQTHHNEAWTKILRASMSQRDWVAYAAFQQKKAKHGYSFVSGIELEFVSDLVAEQFTKEEFWNYLKAHDKNLFADLVNKVRSMLATVRAALKSEGIGMAVYMKNFAAVELAIRDAMKDISLAERKNMGIKVDPAQTDLFKDTGPAQGVLFDKTIKDPEMREIVVEGSRQREEKSKADRRLRTGMDLLHLVYKRMVDKEHFLYQSVKTVLKAAGYDPQTYDPTKNPYHQIRLMAGWASKAHQNLTDVVMEWDTKEVMGPGLQRIFKTFNLAAHIENGEFGQFAQMMRMEAIFKVKGVAYFTGDNEDIGVKTKEAFELMSDEQKAAKADYDAKMEILKRYKKLHPKWAEAVEAISNWNTNTLKRALQSGYLTEDEFTNLTETYDLFVPMNVLKKEAGHARKIAYELGVYKADVVRMDPIDSMIKKAYRLEFLIHLNAAKLAGAKMVSHLTKGGHSLKDFGRRVFPKTSPLEDYVDLIAAQQGIVFEEAPPEIQKAITTTAEMYAAAEFEKDGVVTLKRDGKLEYWQFTPDVMDVFTTQGGSETQFWLKFFSAQTKMLRAGAILTPEFMATNQFRDFMGSMVLSKHLVKNPADFVQVIPRLIQGFNEAVAHAMGKESKTMQEFINSGAGNVSIVDVDIDKLHTEKKNLAKSKRFLMHKSPITILQEITNLFEYSTRFAVFRKTVDDLVAAGVPYEQAVAEGAMEARESSTDFARMGEYGAVLNRIIPFFNAGIQGNDKLYRSLFVDKGRKAQTWAKGITLITAPSVALWMLNHDEDWYEDLPMYIKNHFWTFSFDGGKTIHKLPKPFEIGMIFGSLPERILDWHYKNDPKAMEEWIKNFYKDITPLDGLNLLGPTLATMHEIQSNYDVYRGSPIVKGYKASIMPSEQYTSRTSEFAKVLGKAAPGKGVSPMMIDHFIRGTFGGLGSWGAEIASNIIMVGNPELRQKRRASKEVYGLAKDWYPIVRRMVAVGPPSYTRNMKDFFDEYDSARETHNTFTAFKSGGASKEQFKYLYLTDGAGLEKYKVLQNSMKMAADISKKMAAVEQAPPEMYSREEKATHLDQLQRDRNELFRRAMAEYNKVDWDKIQKQMNKKVNQVMSDFDRANGGK